MGAEKIENVALSCFSALIFLPAYLTNDRNSSNRELLWTELLYIAEFIGVILIWIGYKYCQRPLDPANLSADHH